MRAFRRGWVVELAVEDADETHERGEPCSVGTATVSVSVSVSAATQELASACARDAWCSSTPCTARFPRSMVGCSQPVPTPRRRRMMNDTTVRAMASAQEAPFLDVLQHQGLAVAVCDVGLAPPADEGGVGRLGGATHGGPRRDQSNRPDWMCFAGFLAVLLCGDGAATAPGEFCATACAHNAVSRGRAADGDAYAP